LHGPSPSCRVAPPVRTAVGAPPLRHMCWVGALCVPPFLPRAGFAPPRLCAQRECRAVCKKVRPTASCPHSVEQSSMSAGLPRAAPPLILPPFTHERGPRLRSNGHGNAGARHRPPLSCVPLTHARTRTGHTNEGGWSLSRPSLTAAFALRGRGGGPPRGRWHRPCCPLPARQTGCGESAGAPRMRGNHTRPCCRATPSPVCICAIRGGCDQEEGAHTGANRERRASGGRRVPPHFCSPICAQPGVRDRRGREDGGGHASGAVGPPFSVCVWGCRANGDPAGMGPPHPFALRVG
jgi:hypothetical protein